METNAFRLFILRKPFQFHLYGFDHKINLHMQRQYFDWIYRRELQTNSVCNTASPLEMGAQLLG